MISSHTSLRENNARLLNAAPNAIFAYIVCLTLPYVYLDVYAYENDPAYWTLGIVSWAATYLLFRKLMREGGYLENGQGGGIGTYFVLGIAIGVLVVVGLVALILPGLYLMMRWLPAYSRALTTSEGVSASMWWSWDRTQEVQAVLSRAIIGPICCYAAATAALIHYEIVYYPQAERSVPYELLSSVWVNVWITLGIVWLTILGISAYDLVCDENQAEPDTA